MNYKFPLLISLFCFLAFISEGQNSLYVGPYTSSDVQGRISASGSSAELSLSNRAVNSFVGNPSNGERWVIYNSGTTSDGRLRFWTGGDKVTFTKEGNIYLGSSIGTNSNGGRLSLSGEIAELSLNHRGISDFIENPTQGERWVIYNNGTLNDGRLRFWTGGDKIVFTKEGEIGIGTADPSGLIHLAYSNAGIDYNQIIDGNKIQFERSNNGASYIDKKDEGSLNFRMGPSFATKMTITNSGDVGIGTDQPDAKLTVEGDIHTQEVTVDLQGAVAPDFVFEADYDLKSLEDTEEYIQTNKHLPEIPSAAEMEENGLELKEMNLKLLQKVEELTLHLIEQNKKIKTLERKVETLESEK